MRPNHPIRPISYKLQPGGQGPGQAISAGETGDPTSDNGNIFHVYLLAILRGEPRAFRNGNIFRTLLFISAKTFFLAVAAQNRNTRVLLPG